MFNLLHTYIPSPILIAIGPVSIYWYGLLLAAAVVLGYWLVGKLAERRQLSVETLQSLAVNLVIWGFIGARLYHVLGEWRFYSGSLADILAVWKGGLAIHGAVIAGVIVLWQYARKHRLGFYQLADVFSLPLILGQALSRWGNYFNQELVGRPTSLPWGIPIDAARRPAGFEQFAYFHPAFLYESLWNAGVFIFLWFLFKKRNLAAGTVFWAYVGLYSLGRAGVELLRTDDVPLLWGARLPLAVSAVFIMVSAVMSWRVFKRA